jgi:3-oxoadipate enol-lactonase
MAEMRMVGDSFNVHVDGPERAPAIMLSHSVGTNLHMWDKQIVDLTKRFKVIRYDSRGHGQSAVSGGTYSIAGLGRDAIAIMDALELDRVHWMGLSLGGMVGQWLLTNARERIGRAVLANTAAHIGPPDLWNTRIRTVLSQGLGAIIPATIDRWFTLDFQNRMPGEVDKVIEMLATTPAHGYAGCCGAIRDMDQREAIRGISNPALIIVGKHDAGTFPEAGAYLASAIRGAKLVTLNAAHLTNIEAASAFNAAMMDFFLDSAGRFAPPASAARKVAAKAVRPPQGRKSGMRKPAGRAAGGRAGGARKGASSAKSGSSRAAAKSAKKPNAKATAKRSATKKAVSKRGPAKKSARSRR